MFHNTYEVLVNISYLIIQYHKLPKKYWSLILGGILLWITSNATETLEIKSRGRCSLPIIENLLFSTIASPTGQYFTSIAQYFLNSLDVTISKIMQNKIQLRLTIFDDVQPKNLLFKIRNFLVVYNKTNTILKHEAAAHWLIISPATVGDNTCYFSNLRFGVMLSYGCKMKKNFALILTSLLKIALEINDLWL